MKKYDISFKAKYGDDIYDVKGIIIDTDKEISLKVGDCIFLTYYRNTDEVYLGTINSKIGKVIEINNITKYDVVKCFENDMDVNLNILVMLSLAFIEKFIGKKILYISDNAMKDNASLSWMKFFRNKTTTYSKFGFQLTSPNEVNHFNEIMINIEKNIKQKIPGENITYEDYIKDLLQKSDVYFLTYMFDNEELNVMKIWYMDWKIYDAIPKKVEIYSVSMI